MTSRVPSPAAVLFTILIGVGACADAPSAPAPVVEVHDRASMNLSPPGCPTAEQQFINYYGYSPPPIICVSLGGGRWAIDISFYWDTYSEYNLWYVWLLSNNYTISESCGDQVLDDIMASYHNTLTYTGTEFPTCHEFNKTTSTQYFTHAELSQGNGTDWAWLKTSLIIAAGNGYGADEWRVQYNGPLIATSGYRTPVHNKAVGGRLDSQHMHGDALDVQNVSGTQAEWDAIAKAATDAHAIYIESVAEGGIGHVHADWRNQ